MLQMQWVGPYVVIDKPSIHNYKIKINGKLRTYHANLLKRFIERERMDEPTFSASFIDYDIEEGDHQEEMINELDIGWSGNIKNIIINEQLNQDQVNELKEIINRHQIIFSNKPEAAKIACHKISLTTNVPIITRPYKIPLRNEIKYVSN